MAFAENKDRNNSDHVEHVDGMVKNADVLEELRYHSSPEQSTAHLLQGRGTALST